MKERKLSDRNRRHYAWQFLRRNPDYIALFEDYSKAKEKWAGVSETLPRSKRNQLKKKYSEEKRSFSIRFHHGFGMKAPPLNPKREDLSSVVLSSYFAKINPVFETALAPTGEDDTINVSIRLSYGSERISQETMNLVRMARQRKNIRSSNYQASEKDLKLYLKLLDQYPDFIKEGELNKNLEDNYGLTLHWSDFSRHLNLQGFDVDPKTLKRTVLKTALAMTFQSPFSVLH